MGSKDKISSEVQDAWEKLNARWKGEDATAFHREYVVKISEIVDSFENACSELSKISSECLNNLNSIEQTIAD